jgi:hypothetical protein
MGGVLTCQHVKKDGVRCGSPAMREKRYCFFHLREREHGAKRKAEYQGQRWFEAVDLNDPKAVQRALWEVINRLLEGRIPRKRAAEIIGKLRVFSV